MADLAASKADSKELDGIDSTKLICAAITCGNVGEFTCSACKIARYCSQACQKSDWTAGHKLGCEGTKKTFLHHQRPMQLNFEFDDPDFLKEFKRKQDCIVLTELEFRRAICNLVNPDEVVIHSKRVKLTIKYPVTRKYTAMLTAEGDAFTRTDLLTKIAAAYRRLYAEEERTMTVLAHPPGSMCLNRARTNGTYGIWGHDLWDLSLHTVFVTPPNFKGGVLHIELGVDS
jgi:hypothetical protein